jgi:hypothetical protein
LSESTQAALFSAQSEPVILSPKEAPILLVTVDAEAEFDWNAPKRRDALSVGSILNQGPAQEIFGDYGITPSYLVDFAVVSDVTWWILPLSAMTPPAPLSRLISKTRSAKLGPI